MLINPARNPSIFRRRFPIRLWYPSQHLLRQNPPPRSQFVSRRRFPRAAFDGSAADEHHELAPLHSNTSSARASSAGGTDEPLGRTAATSGGELANSPDGTAEELQGSAQDNAAAPPSSENGMQDQTHSSGAPPKKPQKTARSQNRHRNESGKDYPCREDRADPWVCRTICRSLSAALRLVARL